MRFERENKDLFNAFGNVLDIRGIKSEYYDNDLYVGEAFDDKEVCFYIRPENGSRFGKTPSEIEEIFTPINIDGYQFIYEDFLPYEDLYYNTTPDMIIFKVMNDEGNVMKIWNRD
jgi:hypothetical protein